MALFLPLDFPFIAISRPPRVQSHQLVAWNIHTVVFSSHFCFQVFVVCTDVVTVVNSCFNKSFIGLLMLTWSPLIDASTQSSILANRLPLSFLDKSTTGCKRNKLACRIFFRDFGRYCFTLSRYLLSLPSFANSFWFISSCRVVRLVNDSLF